MTNIDLKNMVKVSIPTGDEVVFENNSVLVSKLYYFNQNTQTTFYELNLSMKDLSGDINDATPIMYQKI